MNEISVQSALDFFSPISLWDGVPSASLVQALREAPPVLKNLETAFETYDDGLLMCVLGEQAVTPAWQETVGAQKQNLIDLAGVASAYVRRQASLQRRLDLLYDRELWQKTFNHLPLMGPSQFTSQEYSQTIRGVELATSFLETIFGVISGGPLLAAFRAFLRGQGQKIEVRVNRGRQRVRVGVIAVVLVLDDTEPATLKPMLKGYFADFDQKQQKVYTSCGSFDTFDFTFSYQTAACIFNYRSLENPLIRDDFDRFIRSTQIDDIGRSSNFFNATQALAASTV